MPYAPCTRAVSSSDMTLKRDEPAHQLALIGLRPCVGADNGVGAYAYQDSTGNRYSGTFKLKDNEFGPPNGLFAGPGSEFYSNFFPEYFRNLQVLLNEPRFGEFYFPPRLPVISYQTPEFPFSGFGRLPASPNMFNRFRAFEKNIENQKLAFNAATKAFDLTSNQAGFVPNFGAGFNDFGTGFGGFNPGFSGFGGFPNFGVPNMAGANSAYASGVVGDGFVHQAAAINPPNPNVPNVDVTSRVADQGDDNGGHFYSVQSSSYATSSNVNGKEENRRGAVTRVNKDGKVTEYKVGN
ncbi:hypothetical protein EVAR_38497_1 [Eumeta japonica]|uniref:Uncharacterized protein n=1 Tax=Eumeta variegata TaxID=151549 RepID=A0A4C1WEH3_EUMVA|nr:hypothetical protein EVAR_38497_1 [Eumeta japonica]